MKVLALSAVLAVVGATALAADMPQPMNAGDIKWGPVPPNLPARGATRCHCR